MIDIHDKIFRLAPKITPLFGRCIPRTFREWCWWNLRGRPEGEEDYGPSLVSTGSISEMKWYENCGKPRMVVFPDDVPKNTRICWCDELVEPKTDMEKRLIAREARASNK